MVIVGGKQQLASGVVTSLTHGINQTLGKMGNFRINSHCFVAYLIYHLHCERLMLPVTKTGLGIQKTQPRSLYMVLQTRGQRFLFLYSNNTKKTGEQICYSQLGFLMTDITDGAGKWREAPYLLHFPPVCYIPSVQ